MRASAPIATALALSACATPRMHSQAELNSVGERCGLAFGEVFQDESEKRLLFMVRNAPTDAQRACVARWARHNHLKTVFVDSINFPES
jgi:hypothetical protein